MSIKRQKGRLTGPGGPEREFSPALDRPLSSIIGRGRLILALVWLAVVLFGSGAASAAEPKVVIGQDRFDFGEVFEDRQLSHTFVVKNAGSAPLEITKVDPDCACTVASY